MKKSKWSLHLRKFLILWIRLPHQISSRNQHTRMQRKNPNRKEMSMFKNKHVKDMEINFSRNFPWTICVWIINIMLNFQNYDSMAELLYVEAFLAISMYVLVPVHTSSSLVFLSPFHHDFLLLLRNDNNPLIDNL